MRSYPCVHSPILQSQTLRHISPTHAHESQFIALSQLKSTRSRKDSPPIEISSLHFVALLESRTTY